MLIFSQVERWNIQFVVELRRFSVVHHVARRVGEVLEDQRTQVHAAGWADAGAGEEYSLESYLTFEMSVQERGDLIDKFNRDEEIFIFILSTRAGSYTENVKSCFTPASLI